MPTCLTRDRVLPQRLARALLAAAWLSACSDGGEAGGPAAGAGAAPRAGSPAGASGAPAHAAPGAAGGAHVTGRAPVPLPDALQAWIDRAAAEVGAPTLTPAQVQQLGVAPTFVDVRDAKEIAVSTVARAMALASEGARLEYMHKGGDGPVVVVSTVGWRAAHYAKALHGAGREAYALQGGLCAWAAAGGRLVDREGRLTQRLFVTAETRASVPQGCEAVGAD